MITDDELAQLPEDPELAFVEFERIVRARYYEAEREEAETQYGNADSYRLEYMNKVLAAARVYEISALAQWEVPSVRDNVRDAFAQFTSDVDHFTTQIRIRHAPVNRQNSVGLDGNTKAKIHHHIEQIRKSIEEAELPEKKRDSLYNKLYKFALEVDKIRTGLPAVMAVYIEVCDGIGQASRNWSLLENGSTQLLPCSAERRKWKTTCSPCCRDRRSRSSLNTARASHHLSEAAVILTMTSPFEGRPAGSMPLGGQPNFSVVEQPRRFTGGLPVEKYFRDQLAGR